jgi:hypothetical protein
MMRTTTEGVGAYVQARLDAGCALLGPCSARTWGKPNTRVTSRKVEVNRPIPPLVQAANGCSCRGGIVHMATTRVALPCSTSVRAFFVQCFNVRPYGGFTYTLPRHGNERPSSASVNKSFAETDVARRMWVGAQGSRSKTPNTSRRTSSSQAGVFQRASPELLPASLKTAGAVFDNTGPAPRMESTWSRSLSRPRE